MPGPVSRSQKPLAGQKSLFAAVRTRSRRRRFGSTGAAMARCLVLQCGERRVVYGRMVSGSSFFIPSQRGCYQSQSDHAENRPRQPICGELVPGHGQDPRHQKGRAPASPPMKRSTKDSPSTGRPRRNPCTSWQ